MELRILFWTTLITGLFASAVLLLLVINQMTNSGRVMQLSRPPLFVSPAILSEGNERA